MAAPLSNISGCSSSTMLLPATESPFNLSTAAEAGPGSAQSLAPLCSACCCGFVNRALAVVFMVSLTFAIVVGNVVTLTVFVQTRQSRTPQGYLKGKCISVSPPGAFCDIIMVWRQYCTSITHTTIDTIFFFSESEIAMTQKKKKKKHSQDC